MRTRRLVVALSLGALLVAAAPARAQDGSESEVEETSRAPKLLIKGFGDINFRAVHDRTSEKTTDTFFLGQVDLFLTSQLSERVAVLSEMVGKFRRATNETVFDVERIHITYQLSDLVNIRAGRMHTALGFWNQTYHHGSWFQTTAERPSIYLFNDVGGILPIHMVGLELFGTKSFKAFDLTYNLGVGNGRGKTVGETENVSDWNSMKAVNVLLTVTPSGLSGLRFGVDGYFDKAPPNEAVVGREGSITERILGGHLVYVSGPVELLSEGFRIRHEDDRTGASYDAEGFYLQGGYQIDNTRPYYRFDYTMTDPKDLYLTGSVGTIRKHTLGIRWDPLTWNGIKLELSFANRGGGTEEYAAQVQSAFTF